MKPAQATLLFLTSLPLMPVLSSQDAPVAPRTLRVAVVQMRSLDHDIDGNLKRASDFARQAAAKGAVFVLFPEK